MIYLLIKIRSFVCKVLGHKWIQIRKNPGHVVNRKFNEKGQMIYLRGPATYRHYVCYRCCSKRCNGRIKNVK